MLGELASAFVRSASDPAQGLHIQHHELDEQSSRSAIKHTDRNFRRCIVASPREREMGGEGGGWGEGEAFDQGDTSNSRETGLIAVA
eukprot:SAG11_NODE_1120_length_5789_cov_12.068190_4_plen_87_part_00